jgi:hypothetical protein
MIVHQVARVIVAYVSQWSVNIDNADVYEDSLLWLAAEPKEIFWTH